MRSEIGKLRLRVCLNKESKSHLLFNIINMKKGGIVDLKITDFAKHGCFTYQGHHLKPILGTSFDKIEMSYHANGAPLYKFPKYEHTRKTHFNAVKDWYLSVPTNAITDIFPIFYIIIRRTDILEKIVNKKANAAYYECENPDFFDFYESFFCLIYLKPKSLDIARHTTPSLFSDILANINETTDLCIYISPWEIEDSKPFWDKELKTWITPSVVNAISFANQDNSIPVIKKIFSEHVLHPGLIFALNRMSPNQQYRFYKEDIKIENGKMRYTFNNQSS